MHIVFTARGLYFSGRARDFRRFLAAFGGSRQTLAEYLGLKLR
jgi:hypothetical protein